MLKKNQKYLTTACVSLCVVVFLGGFLFFGKPETDPGTTSANAEGQNIDPIGETQPDLDADEDRTSERSINVDALSGAAFGEKKPGDGNMKEEVDVTASDVDLSDVEAEEGDYLIVAKNEKIAIYFIDDFGAKQLLQQTDIPYGLLSESDQKLFDKGIVLTSLTEVYELLQDFES